jgi:hypothetical protein
MLVTGLSPEMEGIESAEGRRVGPDSFLTTFKAAVVGLVSKTSNFKMSKWLGLGTHTSEP